MCHIVWYWVLFFEPPPHTFLTPAYIMGHIKHCTYTIHVHHTFYIYHTMSVYMYLYIIHVRLSNLTSGWGWAMTSTTTATRTHLGFLPKKQQSIGKPFHTEPTRPILVFWHCRCCKHTRIHKKGSNSEVWSNHFNLWSKLTSWVTKVPYQSRWSSAWEGRLRHQWTVGPWP